MYKTGIKLSPRKVIYHCACNHCRHCYIDVIFLPSFDVWKFKFKILNLSRQASPTEGKFIVIATLLRFAARGIFFWKREVEEQGGVGIGMAEGGRVLLEEE